MRLLRNVSFVLFCLAFAAAWERPIAACVPSPSIDGYGASPSAAVTDCIADADEWCEDFCELPFYGCEAPYDGYEGCTTASWDDLQDEWHSQGHCTCHDDPF